MFRALPLSSLDHRSRLEEEEEEKRKESSLCVQKWTTPHVVPDFPSLPKWPKESWIRSTREDDLYVRKEHPFFEKEGYVQLPNFLTTEALHFLRAQVAHVWKHKHPCVQESWIMNVHQILSPKRNWMWKLANEPIILNIVRQHLGQDFVFNSAQILVKPPISEDRAGGRIVPWHQDGQILRTLWICLDDVDEENGTLHLKPRWQHLGPMEVKRIPEKRDEYLAGKPQFSIKDGDISTSVRKPVIPLNEIDFEHYCPGGLEEFEKDTIQYRLKAGDCAMHHPSLPHKSMPNLSKTRWRRIIILRYLPAKFKKPEGKFHQNVFTAELFEKHSYLVSGRDRAKQGFRTRPRSFEAIDDDEEETEK